MKENDEPVGRRTKVRVVKNKVAPPFTRCEFDMLYGKGISRAGELLDYATEFDIIQKSGAWYSYKGSKLGQGRDAVRKVIDDNPELFDELDVQVRAKLFPEKAAKEEQQQTPEEPEAETTAEPKKGRKKADKEQAAEEQANMCDELPEADSDLNLTDNF